MVSWPLPFLCPCLLHAPLSATGTGTRATGEMSVAHGVVGRLPIDAAVCGRISWVDPAATPPQQQAMCHELAHLFKCAELASMHPAAVNDAGATYHCEGCCYTTLPPAPPMPPPSPSPPLLPCLCSNSCHLPGTELTLQASDGQCDDGGPDALWSDCPYGTDCEDCGPRCTHMPPPLPPQPPPPALISRCECPSYTLEVTGDAEASQGDLAGAYTRLDNTSVGGRSVYAHEMPRASRFYLYYSVRSFDWVIGPYPGGVHNQGDWAAITSGQTTALCPEPAVGAPLQWRFWSDSSRAWSFEGLQMHAGCPPSPVAPPLPPGQTCACDDSCHVAGTQVYHTTFLHSDGLCDDGGPGAEGHNCDYGTDCTDCGPRCGLLPPPQPPIPPPPPLLSCPCETMVLHESGLASRVQAAHLGSYHALPVGEETGGRRVWRKGDTEASLSYIYYLPEGGGRWLVGPTPGSHWASITTTADAHACPSDASLWAWWSGTGWQAGGDGVTVTAADCPQSPPPLLPPPPSLPPLPPPPPAPPPPPPPLRPAVTYTAIARPVTWVAALAECERLGGQLLPSAPPLPDSPDSPVSSSRAHVDHLFPRNSPPPASLTRGHPSLSHSLARHRNPGRRHD